MDRRNFACALAVLGGNLPTVAVAQATRPRRIGYLGNGTPASGASQLRALQKGLVDLGWVEGRTLEIEYRWAEGHPERIPALVAEFVRMKVEVLVLSGPAALNAAKQATSTLPVVFVILVDPVPSGWVQSLARPGGNMTGLASQFEDLITKQLQLLKEALPRLTRIVFLRHAEASATILAEAEAAARGLGLYARTINVRREEELEAAFEIARKERVGAVHVLPSPYLGAIRRSVIALAARHRLPAFYELRAYVEDGGLMSYGPSIADLYGRSATYVDRILKGAQPAEMPIERPAHFELVINLKTAEALGLTLPQSLLSRADELIR